MSGKVTEWQTETRRKMPTCFPFEVFICLISHSAQSWGETGNGLYRRPSHPSRMKAVLTSNHLKFLILFISCCPIMVSRPWDVQERVWNRSQESVVCSWYYSITQTSPLSILSFYLEKKKDEYLLYLLYWTVLGIKYDNASKNTLKIITCQNSSQFSTELTQIVQLTLLSVLHASFRQALLFPPWKVK